MISGGGGLGEIWKKVCRHKSQKKSLLKMWAEKNFVDGIDERYVDQNKPANGNEHNTIDIYMDNTEGIQHSLIFPLLNKT